MLTDDVRNAIMDVLRVAMSNVVLHSRASSVRISVSSEGGLVTVEVTDDGHGVANAPWGGGLRRLSESAVRLGGELEVTATAEVAPRCDGPQQSAQGVGRRGRSCCTRNGPRPQLSVASEAGRSRAPKTAAWVRRSMPSLASSPET